MNRVNNKGGEVASYVDRALSCSQTECMSTMNVQYVTTEKVLECVTTVCLFFFFCISMCVCGGGGLQVKPSRDPQVEADVPTVAVQKVLLTK